MNTLQPYQIIHETFDTRIDNFNTNIFRTYHCWDADVIKYLRDTNNFTCSSEIVFATDRLAEAQAELRAKRNCILYVGIYVTVDLYSIIDATTQKMVEGCNIPDKSWLEAPDSIDNLLKSFS